MEDLMGGIVDFGRVPDLNKRKLEHLLNRIKREEKDYPPNKSNKPLEQYKRQQALIPRTPGNDTVIKLLSKCSPEYLEEFFLLAGEYLIYGDDEIAFSQMRDGVKIYFDVIKTLYDL